MTGAPIGQWIRTARIVSGLILFAFVLTHFLNHALGLISAYAMEVGQTYRWYVTRTTIGTAILLAAALVHLTLGIYRFVDRRTWRMRPIEAIQLGFGLLIPVLLIPHILGTRGMSMAFGVDDFYAYELNQLWPDKAMRQGALMLLVWIHACIGIHMWLAHREEYARFKPLLAAIATLIPALSYAGFAAGAREVKRGPTPTTLTPDQAATLADWSNFAFWGFLAFLAVLVSLRLVRDAIQRFGQTVTIRYAGGNTIKSPVGPTLLEISQAHGIPHASVCGGRARCSTCRVRIVDGLEDQPSPDSTEARLLKKIDVTNGAPEGSVRLGCQLRPEGNLSVSLLLPADRSIASGGAALDQYRHGIEHVVTVMFTDMRNFTEFSESRLPYDVVFVLNRYLSAMSEAIVDNGGYVDKFMGDGIMAIFGMRSDPQTGARSALNAAAQMTRILQQVNKELEGQIEKPLRMGIGMHTGPAILGRIGTARNHDAGDRVTALGDTVNTASRLEASTKTLGVQIVLSDETRAAARIELSQKARVRVDLQGKTRDLVVYTM